MERHTGEKCTLTSDIAILKLAVAVEAVNEGVKTMITCEVQVLRGD